MDQSDTGTEDVPHLIHTLGPATGWYLYTRPGLRIHTED